MTNDNVYGDDLTLHEARARYFARNGFDADGGYSKKWEKIKLGPIPIYVPNGESRVRALRAHDLHHVLTRYATDWKGEFEISGWEIGSGCAKMGFAWVINLSGMMAGLFRWPGAVFRAFARGRKTGNLYKTAFTEELLNQKVGAIRAQLGLDRQEAAPSLGDVVAFAGYVALAIPVSLGWLVFLPLALPYALVTAGLKVRDGEAALHGQ